MNGFISMIIISALCLLVGILSIKNGENHLGKIWMKLREEYKNKSF